MDDSLKIFDFIRQWTEETGIEVYKIKENVVPNQDCRLAAQPLSETNKFCSHRNFDRWVDVVYIERRYITATDCLNQPSKADLLAEYLLEFSSSVSLLGDLSLSVIRDDLNKAISTLGDKIWIVGANELVNKPFLVAIKSSLRT